VLTANISVVLAGIGMYMLISMMIRYVQTPTSISYGLGASVVVGGLVLLPFSIASYVSSKTMTYISKRVPPDRLVPIGMLAFIASLVVFAVSRDQLWETFVVMALCGVGMGFSFAIMPRLIAGAAPPEQISSALAANQVLRTIGYSIGSALAATILTAHTRVHVAFPDGSGYTVGAVVAMVLCSATAVLCLALRPGVAVAASLAAEDELQVTESVDSAIAGVLAYDLPADVDARTPAGNQVVAD